MKVYLEFDLQDQEQADQHYCALKSQAFRHVIREALAELEEMKRLKQDLGPDYAIELIKNLCSSFGVVIGK